MGSASSSGTTAIENTGGTVNKNSLGVWVAVIVGIVLIVWIAKRHKKAA